MPLTLPEIHSAAALLVNATVWIFGGLSNTQATNGLFTLDVSVAWPTSSPSFSNFSSYAQNATSLFPRYASSMALGADGSSLWIYGGTSNDSSVINADQFSVFDTQARSWSDPQQVYPSFNGEPAPSAYAHSAVRNSKGVVYYYGGSPDDSSVAQDSPYLMTLDTDKNNLSLELGSSGSPGNLAWHTATLVNDTLMYVIGGSKQYPSGNPPANIYNAIYNIPASQWENPTTNSTNYPQGRSGHSAVLSADHSQIIVFGGVNPSNVYLNDVWTLNLATNQWTQRSTSGNAPSGRAYHNSVMVNNQMIVMLGRLDSSSSQVYVLDTTTWAWVTSFNPSAPSTGPSSTTVSAASPTPNQTNPIPISKGGIAGIVIITIVIIAVAVTSISRPRNRVKPIV
jgi:hypothetical protein